MHLLYKPTSVEKRKVISKDHNKKHPDITISKGGLEYDMETALVYAYYASERLAQPRNTHETLAQYDHELEKDANFIPHRERNVGLEHARSEKIARHRMLGLPQLLF